MKILVTGSAGFLGRNLIPLLQEEGHYVIGIDREKEHLSDFFYQRDLRSISELPRISFDHCIHLASAVGGFLFNATNNNLIKEEKAILDGVIALCRNCSCNKIIYTSSINVFEAHGDCVHSSLDAINQYTPYAQAKAFSEKEIERSFEYFTIIRPTNLFGIDQEKKGRRVGESHVIPDLLHKISLATESLEVLGSGDQERNFLHVSDMARVLVLILEQQSRSWINVRSDITVTIKELAEILLARSGKKLTLSFLPEYTKYEPKIRLRCFTPEPVLKLGWRPFVNTIKDGLERKMPQSEDYYSHTTHNIV